MCNSCLHVCKPSCSRKLLNLLTVGLLESHSLPNEVGTGVLWVMTGTRVTPHPARMMGTSEPQLFLGLLGWSSLLVYISVVVRRILSTYLLARIRLGVVRRQDCACTHQLVHGHIHSIHGTMLLLLGAFSSGHQCMATARHAECSCSGLRVFSRVLRVVVTRRCT